MSTVVEIDWWIYQSANAFMHEHPWFAAGAVFLNYALVALFIALVAVYLYKHRSEVQVVMIPFVGACAYLVSRFIGFFYFRSRPFVTHSVLPFINMSPLSKSFPSSHAMVFFAIATALFLYNNQWGKWALILAGLIAILRVFVGVHYPSDILAGAAFGVLLSVLIKRLN